MSRRHDQPGGQLRVYAARSRQLLLAGGLLAVYLATLSLCWQPDPDTGLKPAPGDYLPIVIPGSIAVLYLVWRAMKARIETTDKGINLFRVVGHEWFPWSDVRGFEVLPSPSRRGATVRLRQQNETLVTVRSEISLRPLRGREERRRRAQERAVAFRDVLEADRRARVAVSVTTPKASVPAAPAEPAEAPDGAG
jgi:hypothetical protein